MDYLASLVEWMKCNKNNCNFIIIIQNIKTLERKPEYKSLHGAIYR